MVLLSIPISVLFIPSRLALVLIMVHFIFQLYQIYGRRTPEDVHAILTKHQSNYIILEDSICLAPSRGGCRLPDLIDYDNGVVGIANCCFFFNLSKVIAKPFYKAKV